MWSFFMVRGRVGWVKCWPLWLKNFKTILKKVPKIKFGAANKLLKPHIWSLTSFRFSGRKSQSQQKLAKKITHFTVQVSLKKPFHFTNLNSLNIIKNTLPQHCWKHVSGWCQKKTLHCTIYRHPRTAFSKQLESKWQYIPVNLCSKIFVPET